MNPIRSINIDNQMCSNGMNIGHYFKQLLIFQCTCSWDSIYIRPMGYMCQPTSSDRIIVVFFMQFVDYVGRAVGNNMENWEAKSLEFEAFIFLRSLFLSELVHFYWRCIQIVKCSNAAVTLTTYRACCIPWPKMLSHSYIMLYTGQFYIHCAKCYE